MTWAAQSSGDLANLGWAGLGWAGLGWLGWAGLGWAGAANCRVVASMSPLECGLAVAAVHRNYAAGAEDSSLPHLSFVPLCLCIYLLTCAA